MLSGLFRTTRCYLFSTTCFAKVPVIDLKELEFPQPPHTVRGQAVALAPEVNGVLGHARVLGDILGDNPVVS